MLQFSVPPGYRRTAPVRRPKLDEFTGLIEQWLEDDRRHGYRMTKPYARGATRGEEGRISFSGSGSKNPEAPLRAQESGPISGSPFRMSDTPSYRTSEKAPA